MTSEGRAQSCLLSTGEGLGRCCHAVNHPRFEDRPAALYGVLVQRTDGGLMEHALCAECTAQTRELADEGEVVAVKTIARFRP